MLYLVPTPIGNLADITLRALDVLKQSSVIVCEDTRHTKRLLDHFGIEKNLESYHDHSAASKIGRILDLAAEHETVAYVTDAGMPLISDPGFPLVREALRRGIRVEALPGPFAGVTALAASGLATDSYIFSGFLPQKSGARQKKLLSLADREETLIFYESPYRLIKALQDMREVLGDREAVVAREISKKFEEYKRGRLSQLVSAFETKEPKGEFVILAAGKGRKPVFDQTRETGHGKREA